MGLRGRTAVSACLKCLAMLLRHRRSQPADCASLALISCIAVYRNYTEGRRPSWLVCDCAGTIYLIPQRQPCRILIFSALVIGAALGRPHSRAPRWMTAGNRRCMVYVVPLSDQTSRAVLACRWILSIPQRYG